MIVCEDCKDTSRHLANYLALGFGVFRQRRGNLERGSQRRRSSGPSFCRRRVYENRAEINQVQFCSVLRCSEEELNYILPNGLVRD